MKKNISTSDNAREGSDSKPKECTDQIINHSLEEQIDKWRNEVNLLSYENSLKALDLLLTELQNDNVSVEALQEHYLHAQLHLEHCEKLLRNIEQNIIELNLE